MSHTIAPRASTALGRPSRTSPGPAVELDHVSKQFGDHTVVDKVNLAMRQGEMLCLLGESGSGKTTVLRLIAGLDTLSGGVVRLAGADVTNVPSHQRGLAMVPQQYGLVPHLTVRENVGFGLRMRRLPKSEINDRVTRMLTLTGLVGLENRMPRQISGGQQQRVALARAMVVEPQLLLLDEPMAALDRGLREQMQYELKQLQRRIDVTTLLVTHDQQEALTISDRVAVMKDGSLLQCAPPQELYGAPTSRYVASFMGIPNFFTGQIQFAEGRGVVVDGATRLVTDAAPVQGLAGEKVEVAIRAEDIRLEIQEVAGPNAVEVSIEDISYHGSFSEARLVARDGHRLVSRVFDAQLPIKAGDRAWAHWATDALTIYRKDDSRA